MSCSFSSCDADKDGLSLDEFVCYLKQAYGITISKCSAKTVFHEIDARDCDDDRITENEWKEFLKSKPFGQVQREDLLRMFDEIDEDKSGRLSFDEFLPKLHDKGYKECEVKQLFAEINTNKDAEISRDEWKLLVDKILEKNRK